MHIRVKYWLTIIGVVVPALIWAGDGVKNYVQGHDEQLQAEIVELKDTKADQVLVTQQNQDVLREIATLRDEMHIGFDRLHTDLRGASK